MTAPTLVIPPPALVAVAWLKTLTLPYVDSGDITQGLKEKASWSTDFSVTAYILNSTPPAANPLRTPQAQVSVWGKAAGTDTKAPWNQTTALAEAIRDETVNFFTSVVLTTAPAYMKVKLSDATALTSPHRIEGEACGYARVDLDIQLVYMPIYE